MVLVMEVLLNERTIPFLTAWYGTSIKSSTSFLQIFASLLKLAPGNQLGIYFSQGNVS
jgi:hypothetical protein